MKIALARSFLDKGYYEGFWLKRISELSEIDCLQKLLLSQFT